MHIHCCSLCTGESFALTRARCDMIMATLNDLKNVSRHSLDKWHESKNEYTACWNGRFRERNQIGNKLTRLMILNSK